MTTESIPADRDPRRLLSDVRGLAHRVRVDQRVTWAALLILGAVTLAGIPFDWFGLRTHCQPDGSCEFARRGVLYYWPAALLIAYAVTTALYVRAARARGLGARVLPYAITGAVATVVFTAAWIAAALYFPSHPHQFGYWWLVLDRALTPWGILGIALLVLARLERNLALLAFIVGYLALVLFVFPMDGGWGPPHWGLRLNFALPQLASGLVLLLGAAGFAQAGRFARAGRRKS